MRSKEHIRILLKMSHPVLICSNENHFKTDRAIFFNLLFLICRVYVERASCLLIFQPMGQIHRLPVFCKNYFIGIQLHLFMYCLWLLSSQTNSYCNRDCLATKIIILLSRILQEKFADPCLNPMAFKYFQLCPKVINIFYILTNIHEHMQTGIYLGKYFEIIFFYILIFLFKHILFQLFKNAVSILIA